MKRSIKSLISKVLFILAMLTVIIVSMVIKSIPLINVGLLMVGGYVMWTILRR